jgi:hypothetical protein
MVFWELKFQVWHQFVERGLTLFAPATPLDVSPECAVKNARDRLRHRGHGIAKAKWDRRLFNFDARRAVRVIGSIILATAIAAPSARASRADSARLGMGNFARKKFRAVSWAACTCFAAHLDNSYGN